MSGIAMRLRQLRGARGVARLRLRVGAGRGVWVGMEVAELVHTKRRRAELAAVVRGRVVEQDEPSALWATGAFHGNEGLRPEWVSGAGNPAGPAWRREASRRRSRVGGSPAAGASAGATVQSNAPRVSFLKDQ